MKSFGKSLGVRVAIGAATILSGVYAAALAQKDRQDHSESWSAGMPSLGQPVTPIEGQSGVTTADAGGPALATMAADMFSQQRGTVQLVQHSEPVDGGMELPASLNTESTDAGVADVPNVEPPNWTLPSETETSPPPAAGDSPAMAFPAAALGAPTESPTVADVAPATPAGASAEMGIPVELGPMTDLPEQTFAGDSPAVAVNPAVTAQDAPQVPAADATTTEVPPPYPLEDDVQYFAGGPEFSTATAAPETAANSSGVANPIASDASAGPANVLRSETAGMNTLRGGAVPTVDAAPTVQTGVGLAQQAPQFGQSAQQFDQTTVPATDPSFAAPPQSFADTSAVPSAAIAGQSNFGQQPQARIASLPGQTNSLGMASAAPFPTAMETPTGALPINPDATFDAPGERRLEGAQTPSVIIQKRAPAEVKVGKPASFVIQVQNVGSVEALDVQVHDRIPAGMRLVDASPTPMQQGNLLVWQLGSMPAGDERTLTLQLVPEQEGELGSVARVSFEAAASVRTIATRPELKVTQNAPKQVLIGQQLEIELEVSNPGSGEATGVVLQEDVPEGLEHPKGRQLDNALGNLAPGEVRKQVLRLRAVAPGMIQNTIRLSADDGLAAEHSVAVQVVAPDLQIALKGPGRRYLERSTTYQLDIANAGTADATNVEIAVQLPRGLTFVSTDFEGQYDSSRHAVFWSLAQLSAGQSGSVPLTLLPVEEGEQAIVIDARADLGVNTRAEQKTMVEGFAALSFEITNAGGPIEVGAETAYQIRVANSGSKADSNIRVQLQLPQGLELISADSDAGTDGRGLVAFQPRPNLAPGEEFKYTLRLRGTAPGTHVVKAVIISDQSKVPVTKEESTMVYSDQ